MEWTTRSHLHLDRTASAWLIHRFVDPRATFAFVSWDDTVDPDDPRAFGMPQVPLSSHDEQGTCFAKILRSYALSDDRALVRLETSVAAGVRHALGLPRMVRDEGTYQLGATLDSIGIGLGLLHHDDTAHLGAASPLYDALYATLQLPSTPPTDLPATQPERVAYLRTLIRSPQKAARPTVPAPRSDEGVHSGPP